MSHLSSGGDSFRPAGLVEFDPDGRRFHSRPVSPPASLAAREIEEMARELGIDPDDIPPVRYADPRTQSDRAGAVKAIYDLIDEAGESLPARMSAHEMRNALRGVGIDLGHSTDDAQDRRSTARHEAAHAAVAHSLGWSVTSVSASAGQTKCEPPEYWEQSITDRNLQHAVIAAAGSVGAGTSSWRDENESDRVAVRLKGWYDFETARAKAETLLADSYVKATHQRLTNALIQCGELHGETLRRVLEDDL